MQRGAGAGRGWGVLDRWAGLRAFPRLTHSRLPSLTLQEEGLREIVEGRLAFAHVHLVGDAIQPSHPVIPFCSCLQSYPASGSFPTNQFFTSGGQSIAVSASASVLLMNIQG